MSIAGTSAITELWTKIKSKFAVKSDAIKSISRDGTTFTATRADNTTFTFTQQDSNTTYNAATQDTAGLMSTDDKKKLDGIAAGANAYTHPTTSGNKHVPSGGSSGQFLGWSSDGTAKWVANPNTNTWRGIQDNLTSSTNTTESLSAKQGYLLANGSARDNTKLPLTGGTITGDLTLKRNDIDAKQENNGISAVTYPTTFNVLDKNGLILTRKEAVVKPEGPIEAYWYVRNYNSEGTTVAQKGIKLSINKAGTLTYTISDSDNFRNAINAVSKAGDTMTGALTIKKTTAATNTYADANPKVIFQNEGANQNISLTFTDYDSVQTPASLTLNGNQGGEYFIAPNIKATSNIYVGSTAVSLSGHTHSYLPLSGGTLTGRLTTTKSINQIITGSGTAASDKGASANPRYFPAKWTFNTGLTATNGDIITIKIPVAGHSYGVYISIDNGTNYHPVVLNGTSRLTTHYPVNTYITVIFESTGSAASIHSVAGSNATSTVSGGVWRVINYYDANSNTVPQAQCETAAATAAKAATMTYFALTAKSYVMVNIRYANTVAGAITLNINGTGAKPIYINDAASSASNYTLPAGSYLVYYNGTNYYFRTDGKITGDITGNAATVNGLTVQTAVPTNAKFTDTTYSSKTAASGGTDVSLVTTGEKYTWNNKSNLTIGTSATTAAAGNHTHDYTNTRVKGDAETDYRTGDVNLTPANIGALPLAGGTMTGELVSDISDGVSYIRGVAGEHAGLFKKKPYDTNAWIPMVATQTKGHGGWAIGNYNDETLEFVYGTKANIDSDTNTCTEIYFTETGGAYFPGTIFESGVDVHAWTKLKQWSGKTTQTWSKGSYSEFILECGYSTTYWSAICVPADIIGSSLQEFYLGGGQTTPGSSTTNGRCCTIKVSATQAVPNTLVIDAVDRTANATWRIYGR